MNSKNGNDADEFMEKDGGSSPDLSSGKKGANDSYRQSFMDKADVLYHRIVAPLPSGLQAILAIIALSLYLLGFAFFQVLGRIKESIKNTWSANPYWQESLRDARESKCETARLSKDDNKP